MSRRDRLTRGTPCGDDCADEAFYVPPRRTPPHYPRWVQVVVVLLALFLAAAFGGTFWPIFTNACEAQAVDSAAVILSIENYWPDSANVFVQGDSGFQSVARVPPNRQKWVVVRGPFLGSAAVIRVIAMPIIPHHVMFEFEPILRNTDGTPTPKQLQIGEPPKPKEAPQS